VKKVFVLAAVVLSLGACSSAEKKEMNAMEGKAANAEAKANSGKEEAKAEAAEMAASKATCTLDQDTRIIEVKKTEAGGCELFYTKFGESKSVASSGFGTQYCEEVKDRIESNLNKAGFTCQ
jgi:hypothetical protein